MLSLVKPILGILAVVLGVVGYTPYFIDIFKHKTKPHLYTWLIWSITQGTAAYGVWSGGGKFGALGWILGAILVIVIFFLSFKFGTKNITKGDTLILAVAFCAVVVWWITNNLLIAVIMVSAIDGLGYIPTFRKTYAEPWTETPFFWLTMAIIAVLTIAANAEYNVLTLLYPSVLLVSNIIVYLITIYRRRIVAQPVSQ